MMGVWALLNQAGPQGSHVRLPLPFAMLTWQAFSTPLTLVHPL